MLIGAHVRGGGALVDRLERGVEIGCDAIQIFTQSPRAWKPTQYAPDVLAGYRAAARAHPSVRATFCHATYLINLATSDDVLYERSVECLINNLSVARGMGASGLVLHIGSHKGAGIEGALVRVTEAFRRALDVADDPGDDEAPSCPILLENAAGSGGTVGRTLEELEMVIAAAGGDERLGVCIDTQHLWASGVDYSSVALADAVVTEVRTRLGIERLGCLHLNDSKVDFGSNRDRHENPGEGTIGATGLASLLGHPDLSNAPALLEVPGDGDGPRAVDVIAARAVLDEGLAMRSGSAESAAPAARSSKSATRSAVTAPTTSKKSTATSTSPRPAAKTATTAKTATPKPTAKTTRSTTAAKSSKPPTAAKATRVAKKATTTKAEKVVAAPKATAPSKKRAR